MSLFKLTERKENGRTAMCLKNSIMVGQELKKGIRAVRSTVHQGHHASDRHSRI